MLVSSSKSVETSVVQVFLCVVLSVCCCSFSLQQLKVGIAEHFCFVSISDALFLHCMCRDSFFSPEQLRMTTVYLMKEMEFFKKKALVYFLFITSHLVSLNRWVAFGQVERKHQNVAVSFVSIVLFKGLFKNKE